MLYSQMVPAFVNALGALTGQLEKARAWGADQGKPDAEILTAQLAPDMFPLSTQVRFSCVQALQAVSRLGAQGAPAFAEDAVDFEGMKTQIETTTNFLSAMDSAQFDGDSDRKVSFNLPNGMIFDLSAAEYVRDWALPQFYFHIMAAYAVMRQAGVPLGKADFASYMMRHLRPGTTPTA
jgi:uncharacterized protein